MLKKSLYYLIFVLGLLINQSTFATSNEIVITKITGDFTEVKQTLNNVIEGKGLNIAHSLDASGMLTRTSKAFDIKKSVYSKAEIVEFCSAKISHKLVQIDPANIILCPFTISIYSLHKEPKTVYLAYRRPSLQDKASKAATNEIVTLLDEIIKEVSDW